MSIALLVFPDFLLLALGLALRHRLGFDARFFSEVERLVYYILFPALLFQTILARPIDLGQAADLLQACLLLMAAGAGLSWLALVLRPDPVRFASVVQCGFRFNSYLALALAHSMGGADGAAVMALLIGFGVPLANFLAVYALARHGGSSLLGALLRNPLFVTTLLALVANFSGLVLPEPVDIFLRRLGAAALALGLICVGASLTVHSARGSEKLVGWMMAVKLLALPLVAVLIGRIPALDLSPLEQNMLLLFAALPTASSAYVLAARMGGDGRLVALLISLGTVASLVTIPLWMLLMT
ncbi:AEC family transporter [Verticiella sediminum]|uniref:AEC family transporter n=1 Tax=Verticiella sediminum TaxID=1247510 RepID=A0A556AAX5_9BURK|nr:AEC family transporter [Verticiella sediminum]TSH90045.1 AEC family transporter [Verticiella sediminum]